MNNLINQICDFVNHAIQDVRHFINRLAKPDIDLWLSIILPLAIGLAIFLCGGYVIGILPNIKLPNMIAIMALEAALIIWYIIRKANYAPPEERDPFDIIGGCIISFIIAVIAIILCVLLFKWPRIITGIVAAIHLTIIAIYIMAEIKEWQAEKHRVKKRFA